MHGNLAVFPWCNPCNQNILFCWFFNSILPIYSIHQRMKWRRKLLSQHMQILKPRRKRFDSITNPNYKLLTSYYWEFCFFFNVFEKSNKDSGSRRCLFIIFFFGRISRQLTMIKCITPPFGKTFMLKSLNLQEWLKKVFLSNSK